MNFIKNLVQETTQILFGLFIIGVMTKLFLRHTLIGRIIAVILRDTLLFIKTCLRGTKRTSKFVFRTGKRVCKYVSKKRKERRVKIKNVDKKVVNGVM
jgi:hypothetical protein